MKRKTIPWLRILVHILGWLPLGAIVFAALTGRLSVNPIQDIEQRLGRTAIKFLMASLAITPVITLTGWSQLAPRRRAVGLYAFMYVSLHVTTFAAVDYGFDWPEIGRQIVEKPYILAGLSGLLLLTPLAITSFDFFMRKMGKRWKKLHRLIYFAGGVVVLHYAWAKKGDLFTLRGDILKPLTWGLVLALLLILRIPPVRRWAAATRQKLAAWWKSRLRPAPAPPSVAGEEPQKPR
jgi:sulfoxide reductase heme-binding subunit YedZ